MDPDTEAALAAGLAADMAGRPAESYRLLRPLADAGHPQAMATVGSSVAYGMHRFETYYEMNSATEPTVDAETAAADLAEGVRLLEAASAAGVGAASFNLAGLVVLGYGGASWEEQKARAAELYALAYAQGFTQFGWLTNGNGPGQPYLDVIEGHAKGDAQPS